MVDVRITQEVAEVVRTGNPDARITQQVVEVLRTGVPDARITQQVVEVLRTGVPDARITQQVVEVLYRATSSEASLSNQYVQIARDGLPDASLSNQYVQIARDGLPDASLSNQYVQIARGSYIYTQDFSGYSLGQPLLDWSNQWDNGSFTYYAQTNSGDYKVGTKWVNFVAISDAISAVTSDVVGLVADTDIVIKIDVSLLEASDGVRIYSRISGAIGSENGYFLNIRSNDIAIEKYVAGTYTPNLEVADFSYEADTSYWVRYQTWGTTIQAKIWAENALEPDEWKITTTDSSLASGLIGFGGYEDTVDYKIDYFSAGVTINEQGIFPPEGWEWDDVYGFVGDALIEEGINFSRAMGGKHKQADKVLVGVQIKCALHDDDIRISIYSGGDLSTGLNDASLIYDFGKTTGTELDYIEVTCSPTHLPVTAPVWVVVKGDNTNGFKTKKSDKKGNSGNFQKIRGHADVTAIIGTNPDVAFPDTFPDTDASFSDFWYDFKLLLSTKTEVTTPTVDPPSGNYLFSQSTITMNCALFGATIYYTTNGNNPGPGDTEYTAPFVLGMTATVKAIAILDGYSNSEIVERQYVVEPYSVLVNLTNLSFTSILSEIKFTRDVYASLMNLSDTSGITAQKIHDKLVSIANSSVIGDFDIIIIRDLLVSIANQSITSENVLRQMIRNIIMDLQAQSATNDVVVSVVGFLVLAIDTFLDIQITQGMLNIEINQDSLNIVLK